MLALIAVASAVPRFVSDEPQTVALAQAAWAGAVACTGRSPPFEEVQIVFDLPALEGAGFAGLARFVPGQPGRIRLAPRASSLTVAHEVAHAWVHAGPLALVEGRTEVLASCVKSKAPETFRGLFDRVSPLEHMPDLLTWATHGSDMDAELDAYLGSFRYFRAVSEVVPPEVLWSDDLDTWPELEALLAAAGERGAGALAALRGGVGTQRAALVDTDFDGIPAVQEALRGTDPTRRDTDGDGWWDGAPADRAPGALPLPATRRPICLERVPQGTETVTVRMGGGLGGFDIPELFGAKVAVGGLVTWESGWQRFAGGVWVAPVGEPLVPNPRCAMRPDLVVRSVEDAPDGAVSALADQFVAGRTAVLGLGVPVPPLTVTIGGTRPYAEWIGEEIQVPSRVLQVPELGGSLAAFAATMKLPAPVRPAAALALLAASAPKARTGLLSAPGYAVAEWTTAARRCATGWPGVISGACPRPG